MPVSPEFRDYLLELLEPLGRVVARRMFSGVGLFREDVMFAIIVDDVVYLKVDEESRAGHEAAGSQPFSYMRDGRRRGLQSYWRVPDEVLEDEDKFASWARRAILVAFAADAAKPPGRSKRKGPA